MDFELGNGKKFLFLTKKLLEPNDFRGLFNISLSGSQISHDYKVLGKLLSSYDLYKNSKIIGPSTSQRGKSLLQE